MTRLPNLINRDDIPAELIETYDRVASFRGGAVSGPYGILLHSPELAERAAALGQFVRWNSELTAAQRETAIITAARHWDAELMWGGHVLLARKAGVREEVIDIVGSKGDLQLLTDGEAAIISYVRELLETNRVKETTFSSLHRLVGDAGIVDLTGLVGYYATVGFTLNAFEVPPPHGVDPLPD